MDFEQWLERKENYCRKPGWPHRMHVLIEAKDAQKEICLDCNKTKIYNKDEATGRVDNIVYLLDHARDTAQPRGPTAKLFRRLYGSPSNPLVKADKLAKQTLEDADSKLDDAIYQEKHKSSGRGLQI